MGVIGSPNTVRDGLILHLDAANIKSFRGEPTTNYLPTWLSGIFNWSVSMDGGASGTYQLLLDSTYGYKIRYQNTADTGRYYLSVTGGGTSNSKRTFSIYVRVISYKNLDSYLDIYCDFYGVGGGGGPYYHTGMNFNFHNKTISSNNYVENIFVQSIGNEWYRIGFTTTFTDATSGGIYTMLYDNSVIELAYGQLEYKSYATAFVNGTRGATVATGGGWIDLSGGNHHVTFVNDPIYDGYNMGSVVFDGTDVSAYVDNWTQDNDFFAWSPSGYIGLSNMTISCWVKTNNDSGYIYSKPWHSSGAYNVVISTSASGWGFHLGGGNPFESYILSIPTPESGVWINLVCWANSTYCGYYVNGTGSFIAHNLSFSNNPIGGNSTYPIALGVIFPSYDYGGSLQYQGNIAQVQVYNRVLSQSEITQNYIAFKHRYDL